MAGPTITVRGEGGAVSEMDVPDEGTVGRELFDDHIAKGRYVVLSGDWPPAEDEDWPPDEDEGEGPDEDEGEGDEGPDESANVGEWRAYAASVDPDNADVIAKMSKAALVEQYGTEPAEDEGGKGGEA